MIMLFKEVKELEYYFSIKKTKLQFFVSENVENADPDPSRSSSSSSTSSSSSSSNSSSTSSSSESEDCDDPIMDQTYKQPTNDSASDSDENHEQSADDHHTTPSTTILSEITNNSSIANDIAILTSPLKKGRKRKVNAEQWQRNQQKKARNSGKEYKRNTKDEKLRPERKMKQPCTEKCRIKCAMKFTEEERVQIFSDYWALGDLSKQRQYIANSMKTIQSRYQYVRVGGTRPRRQSNNAFYFRLDGKDIRVCKVFFKNTLDINDRPIRTVLEKRDKVANILMEEEKRGKHGNQATVDVRVREGMRNFIETIPKIESHYTRANTSKHFIDGSKTIAELHKDYLSYCKENNFPHGNYVLFYRVFTNEFNISFFVPKKDQCDLCFTYANAEEEEKQVLKEKYDNHLNEKELSRIEKKNDKEKMMDDTVVAVYDLQAVMQLPKGEVSVFYYKSKLNLLNFTIYDLKENLCECYVWDESHGNRGVNELGTCILKYLREKTVGGEKEFIFYSDNCAGQQKNKFMIALYYYAVQFLNIRSITHKYLIKGHTQNEGDSAHSLIERQVKKQLKGGPMYTPEAFISAIKMAKKKGKPFHVNELLFDDFYDVKRLQSDIGPVNMTSVKTSEIKILKIVKDSPNVLFYKTSYADAEYTEAVIIKKKKRSNGIELYPAFSARPGINERKKKDLMDLVQKNLIPKFYKGFYENL
ncbi:hypothetical protein ACJJTC_019066 [Scirpophaga incertulas]